ncbi:hypothetical protein D3C75_890690 [compost metagenome]
MAGAVMALFHVHQVALEHLRCRFGVAGRVVLVAGQAVLPGRRRQELEQALGIGLVVVRALVEAATGLDVGKAQEVLAGDALALCHLLDDVENFLFAVVTLCHDTSSGVDGAAFAAIRQPDSSVSLQHVGQQVLRGGASYFST